MRFYKLWKRKANNSEIIQRRSCSFFSLFWNELENCSAWVFRGVNTSSCASLKFQPNCIHVVLLMVFTSSITWFIIWGLLFQCATDYTSFSAAFYSYYIFLCWKIYVSWNLNEFFAFCIRFEVQKHSLVAGRRRWATMYQGKSYKVVNDCKWCQLGLECESCSEILYFDFQKK